MTLAEAGPDRVAVRGARGRARPSQLKVSVGYLAGYVGEGEIGYAGTNALARAQLAGEIIRERLDGRFAELRIDLIGSTSLHGRAFDTRRAALRGAAARRRARAIARGSGASSATRSRRCTPTAPAGGGGTRKYVNEQIGIVSTLLDRERVRDATSRSANGARDAEAV